MKHFGFTVLMLAWPGVALAESQAMLKKAEQSRRAAEEKLGRNRLGRTNERVEWTQKMQTVHTQLAKIEEELETIAATKQKLETQLIQIEKNKALTERRIGALSYALRRTAGYPDATTPIEDFEVFTQAMNGGLQARLDTLKDMSSFQVEEAEVIDRTGNFQKVRLIRLGIARAMALGKTINSAGLLRKTEDQQWLIDGVELDVKHIAMLQALANGKGAYIPVDIDGSLAQQSYGVQSSTNWLKKGGSFVWPIILVGLLGLLLLAERITYLFFRKARASTIAAVKRSVGNGDLSRAQKLVEPAQTGLDRVLLKGIETLEQPLAERESALEEVLLAEEPRLERSLTLLAAAAGVAPLLGLLGTVTGMIGTFDVIAQHGTGNPHLLSGGISMALITTQLGLIVAVPLLLGHAWVSREVEKRQALLEEGRTAILGLKASREVEG